MKAGFLDKLIERLGKLDSQSLETQFLRLTKERGLLEAVFNAIYEGIIVLDDKATISYANSAAATLLGFPLETAIHQPLSRYLKDIKWNQILNLDTDEWSKLISHEIEITYPEHKFLNLYIMPISLDEQGRKGKGAVVIFRDITGDREREQSVVESERIHAITLLAAGVAHEIGNPLNSINIHLQLMKRELKHLDAKQREPFEELLKVARNEVERLNHIITQFLRAIRPTVPRREVCQIEELLKETLEFMKQDINNHEILVNLKCSKPIPKISIDPNQIKQAFFNVIKNAVEAMSHGGLLTISVFSKNESVGISFNDIGVGIPASQFGRLFKPFSTTKPDGTGLGLMIVQRIVQEHGGQIEVHTQPNVGTTFTIFLPLKERHIRLLKAPKNRGAKKSAKQKERE